MIVGFWKVSGGEKFFWLLMLVGFFGGGSVCEDVGCGKGVSGGKFGFWGVCGILFGSLDFIL